jgi:hypothetical protein
LDEEEYFKEDPELYTVALFLAAEKHLRVGTTIYSALEKARFRDNLEEATKLLKRKAATSK